MILTRSAAALSASALSASAALFASAASAPPAAPRGYIVRLRGSGPAAQAAGRFAGRLAFRPRFVYPRALRGFAADLSPVQVEALRRSPEVLGVYPDGIARVSMRSARVVSARSLAALRRGQRIPTGVSRSGGAASATASIDGVSNPLSIGVAVIDTGIDLRHKDLNVVGGFSTVDGTFGDQNGHGTHVAGIIAAKDNRRGVVGMAPGARLWSVRVLNKRGEGPWSAVIAGLDWVAQHAADIRVANLSLGGSLPDDAPVRAAVEGCVAAGVTVVAAAGNDFTDADFFVPARFGSAITVSAMADNNGQPGSSAGMFEVDREYFEADESFADFSNWGEPVDLIAPGVEILSTWKNGRYARVSGTSQAAPHVAGAAALYLLANPVATPAEVESALRARGSLFMPFDDPDGVHEPALDVAGL